MSPLNFFLTLLLMSATRTIVAQVPSDKTFKIINQGEFGDYITEYNANYRIIQTESQSNIFSSGPFQLFFYNTTPNAYILAIRAGHPKDESLMRWVWDANRNNPVGEQSTLSLNRDGNLVLAESNGRVKWQTNTVNKGVTGLRLMPNGNLVLHDKNGGFIWQSFDHPTDTLLTGQSLRTVRVNKLVSRKSDTDGSDGPYSMVLANKGLTMYVNKTGQSLAYGGWTERDFNGSVTFDVTREIDNVTVPSAYEIVLKLGSADASPGNKRRRLLQVRKIGNAVTIILNKINYDGTTSFLRLGSDGSLTAFTYFERATYLKWEETFAFFSTYFVRRCGLPSWCGEFGYCDDGMCVACPTPKGLIGWSEKCSPPIKTQFCGDKVKSVNYYKIVGVEHFNGPYVDDGEGPTTVSDCKKKCDGDCKCLGFFFKEETNKCLLASLLGTLIKDVKTSIGYIKY